jgi:glyoxylase-like metal-dependent hydrolase (beta-lactamase superfamily II)
VVAVRESAAALPEGVIVLERGWLSANNIVVNGRLESAVVDSGYGSHSRQTVALVAHAIGHRALALLVNTHLHSDHCGGNAALQEHFPKAVTLIPPGLAPAVRVWDEVALTYEPTGQTCPRFRADGVLRPGTTIKLGDTPWQVHAAPGHDQHSVILFEPASRTLISADALWQNGFGVVFQELEGEDAFDEVAATLDLIQRLAPVVVIPGHGPVFSGVSAALDRARSRLEAYRASPRRHAAHAAKVLLKFKLLEFQQVQEDALLAWAGSARYFNLVHQRWFSDVPRARWFAELIDDLVRSGAAQRTGTLISN